MLRLSCLATVLIAINTAAHAQTPPAPSPSTSANADAQSEDVLLRAKLITEDREAGILIAEGDVEIRFGDRSLFTDRLVWDQDKRSLRAQGRVQIRSPDGSIQFADEIELDEEFKNGFATRFSVRLPRNATAAASAAVRTDGIYNSLEQVVYTGCPVCEDGSQEPTWSLRARRAVQNTETQMISYQDAVLEIKGVPILYIPYFAHPDPSSDRRSGLLTPSFGSTSALGPFIEQPYYWAISPHQELTVSPFVSTNVTPVIKAEYRKRFFSGEIEAEGSFTYERDFDSDGNKFGDREFRGHIFSKGLFDINQNWAWGFGVEKQSDDLYDRRYDIDGEDRPRGLYSSQPRQHLSQVFTTGQHEDFYFEAGLLAFQGLRANDNNATLPKVAPTVFAQKIFDFGTSGQLAADFSAVALFRDEIDTLPNGDNALDTARATVSADWGTQYIMGPGFVVEPFVLGRADAYRIDDGVSGDLSLSRTLGLAGVQASMPFIRRGDTIDWLVEPVVMAAYGTEDANDPRIPNEDSLLFEVDDTNLFRPNAVSNYDLWEGGGRAVLGISTKAKFGNSNEVSALLGRRWRQEADPAFSDLSNLAGEKSDYIATVKADFGQTFSASTRMRLDDDFNLNRIDVDAGASFWRINTTARYYKIISDAVGNEDEGVMARGSFRLTDNISATYMQQRNITRDQDIRLSLGLAYQDDCSFFAISYERSGARDRTLGPSESIRFRFVLTGLGGMKNQDLF